jgi:hypothetical protein
MVFPIVFVMSTSMHQMPSDKSPQADDRDPGQHERPPLQPLHVHHCSSVFSLRSTAKALGLDVPLFFQQRADEVIE